ncbi:ABC transporter permease [Novosphingobium mangrovi (ex Huang et al. 2023)]|uniref:ABC transporter permease n=1 Tax=Novosphingobium mangrovi (ex Huang et al. 2023) TaxID=2976432 RepID=A0ABT2I1B3_9SPHN|nr:ABC transporter permease [Novosphingobium mangrovi (ex Huang et al. 2023)]MCT2398591.1 ABC transporter permease [Novosphingobium mangrovi (ex Huang et al. 2023)]
MNETGQTGRLSVLAAAWVVARRDFVAILFSRSFLFFLLGPLFPVVVAALAGSVGQRVDATAAQPEVGIVMTGADADAMVGAHDALAARLGEGLPNFVVLKRLAPGEAYDPADAFEGRQANIAAVLSGTPRAPMLTGPTDRIHSWSGVIAMVAAQAVAGPMGPWPDVTLKSTISSSANERAGRLKTAQAAQMLLFLLTMMLAGMVLSNLVEEKGNKIIEVLAAAIPMDSVFLGKLFAMLAVSLVGIAVWGGVGTTLYLAAGSAVPHLPTPAVGWPLLIVLGVIYFSMAYLLLGSVFLSIGSMATTVREVQTISMPVTMMQLMVFFLASYAMTLPGSGIEVFAVLFPFSSPFAMLARAAQDPALWPHVGAVIGQGAWVLLLVRGGSALFRKRVMKSGPGRVRKKGARARWKRRATAGSAVAASNL